MASRWPHTASTLLTRHMVRVRVMQNSGFRQLLIVSCRQSIMALWGISTYFGKQQSLTQCGHLVGHVRSDEGVTKRVSNCTPVPLNYHADNSDIVFLACRSQAKSGGEVKSMLLQTFKSRRPVLS